MNKKERAARFNEMMNLYFDEENPLSFAQIGDRFGITRQAVYDLFKRKGVKARRPGARPHPELVGLKKLRELYEKDELYIKEIQNELGVARSAVRRELVRHQIEIRGRGLLRRKYVMLDNLQIGETIILEKSPVANPYRGIYAHAARIGIKISIRSIGQNMIKVTRR